MYSPQDTDWNRFWSRSASQQFGQPGWSKQRILKVLEPYAVDGKKTLDAGCSMMKYGKIIFIVLCVLSLFIPGAAAQEVLIWQDCLREAARNHPDLVVAHESVEQSKTQKTVAASGLFPQVTASAGLSTAQADKTGNTKSSSYGISGEQLLFDGFKTTNSAHSASENIKAANENFRFTSSQVRLRLRTAFIDLLKAQALVKIADDIYKIRRENVQLISLRYESGTEHRGALLTAQANLSEAEFEQRRAHRDIEVARQGLMKELGRQGQDLSPVQVQGEFTVTEDIKQKPGLEMLAEKHPDLLKTVAQKNAAAYDIKSSKGDFAPTVSLEAGASKTGVDWPPGDQGSDVGLRVSLPLFEGGLRMAQLKQARSIYRQLQASEHSTKDGVVLRLQEAWSSLENSVENIGVQQKFLAATEERAKISEAQYSVGLISFDNWTIIEDDLVRQKKSFLDAQANALLAQANWIEAKGETLEYEE